MSELSTREPARLEQRRKELEELADGFVDAFNRQDIDTVMSFFSETAVYEDSFGAAHTSLTAIRSEFEPLLDGRLGKIHFGADDRFIDAGAGKVMDSWHLLMNIGTDKERTLRGLDLLHFDGDRLVRKITYKQD